MRFPGVAFLLLLGVSCATPPTPPAKDAFDRFPGLDQRISFHFTGTLQEHATELGRRLSMPVILHRELREGEGGPFRFRLDLDDVRASSVLRWMGHLSNTHPGIENNVIVLGPKDLVDPPQTVVYDAPELLLWHPDQTGPGVRFARFGGCGFEFDHADDFVTSLWDLAETDVFGTGVPWADMMRDVVAPGTWEGNRTLEVDAGRLVITQERRVHQTVQEVLRAVAPFADARVAVSAEIGEAVDGAPAGRPLSPEEAASVEASLRRGPTRRLEMSARRGRIARVSSRVEATRERNPDGSRCADPAYASELSRLQARVSSAEPGSLWVDLELSWGTTSPRPERELPQGKFTPLESGLVTIDTRLRVPAGGGYLLTLPGAAAAAGPARHCLIRAWGSSQEPVPPVVLMPGPLQDADLRERLWKMDPVSVDFRDEPVEALAAWLRSTLKVNVVLDPCPERITFVARDLPPLTLLDRLCKSSKIAWWATDEAVYLAPRLAVLRDLVRIALIPVDDLADRPADFLRPGGGAPDVPWCGEDLANFIKNTVDRDSWEEADGKLIWFDAEHRMLLLRNTSEVIDKVVRYLDDLRRRPRRPIAISARILSVSAEVASRLLKPLKPGETVETGVVDALERSGRVIERLDWAAAEDQITCPSWERSLEEIGEAPISGTPVSSMRRLRSWVEVLPRILYHGSVDLTVKFGEEHLADGAATKPRVTAVSGQLAASVAPDRWALTTWTEPAPGGVPRVAVLALRAVTSTR